MKTSKLLFTVVAIIIILAYQNTYAQINKGGVPQSFSRTGLRDSVLIARMPVVNLDSLLVADAAEQDEERPFRFGYAMDVDMGLHNSGTWDTLSGGDKIWRLKIYSEGAFSINLIYDNFWLPEGAQFFVYNEDQSMVLGAFTADVSNNEYNKFATDLVQGNSLVLDYYEPAYASGGIINIDKIIHGYINTFSDGLGMSGSCNIDVNCSQGSDWCVEKRAVSMILVDDNTAFCTGCLINNVKQDLTPYYLTANHCLSGNPNTWIFRFKYWKPTCGGNGPNHWVSITGSTIRANHAATDFALLELFAQPPSGFGVLYAGWDRSASPATSATAIHHPRGDAMKISHDFNSLTSVSWMSGATNHWRAIFDQGIVQNGSSGSPLFNQEHKIIGQLHGNQNNQCSSTDNSCHCSQTPIGEYGKFDVSWTGGGTSSTRLSNWLDPDNTGTTTIGATSPTIYLINRTLTGTHKFAALGNIHIEGNIVTGHPFFGNTFCQTNNIPFTAEPGSNVTVKAKSITIHPGTEFKAGSEVSIIATDEIECSDNIVEGDYVNVFCNAQISMKMGQQTASNDNVLNSEITEEKLNLSEQIILYPNPNSGQFQIEFLDDNLKSSEIIIYDVAGKIVYEQNKIVQNKIQIDLCNLQKGIYLVQIIHTGNSYTKRIILQ